MLLNNLLQGFATDVATTNDNHYVLVPVLVAARQQTGECHAGGTFGQHVVGIDETSHGLGDLFLGNQHEFIRDFTADISASTVYRKMCSAD